MKKLILACLLLGCWKPCVAQAETEFNFERPGLTKKWSAQGKIKVQRGRPSEVFSDEVAEDDDAPKLSAVHLMATAQSVFFTKPDIVPKDWSRFEELSFWVNRGPDASEPTIVEFQVFEKNTRVRFWRKITIDHVGWKRYSVPLRWMRWSEGRIPAWNRVARLGLYFRNSGNLWIDSIRLHDKVDGKGAMLTAEDLKEIAFSDREDAMVAESGRIRVISAVEDLDRDQLLTHLSKIKENLDNDFPLFEPDSSNVSLIVCDDEASYHRFTQDLVSAMNSQRPQPTSGGLTLRGIPLSYWSPRHGTLRPVYTHEFVHGWMMRKLQIANQGEWLHEGIATYYQLKFHPQENISDLILQGIENRQLSDPLQELCDGERIRTIRYWQAMTVVDMLMNSKKFRGSFSTILQRMQESGSTNLSPHLGPVLKTNWNKLTDDWREFCREKYDK